MYCGICNKKTHDIYDCNRKDWTKTLLTDYKCLICYDDTHKTEDCFKLTKKGPCSICYHHTIAKCRRVKNFV